MTGWQITTFCHKICIFGWHLVVAIIKVIVFVYPNTKMQLKLLNLVEIEIKVLIVNTEQMYYQIRKSIYYDFHAHAIIRSIIFLI